MKKNSLLWEVSFLHILYEFHEIKLNVMKYALNIVFHEIVWKMYFIVYPHLKDLCNKYGCNFDDVSENGYSRPS